ncbi:PAS domain-containing protein [Streptomyces sp. NPDC006996]|uniref:PAS domain-containing protein n=1 Tax=Streptomyces sp. NPDC006996 TaxID=3156908 RepID=UPI0033FD5795
MPVDLVCPGASHQVTRYFTFSMSHATTSDGRHGVLGVIVEVTEQVTAAERIRVLSEERRRALERYRSLVDAGSQMVWVTGPKGGVTEPSPGWQRVTGQSWEEFRGDGWTDALHPDDRAATVESWQRALDEQVPRWTHTYRLRLTTGGPALRRRRRSGTRRGHGRQVDRHLRGRRAAVAGDPPGGTPGARRHRHGRHRATGRDARGPRRGDRARHRRQLRHPPPAARPAPPPGHPAHRRTRRRRHPPGAWPCSRCACRPPAEREGPWRIRTGRTHARVGGRPVAGRAAVLDERR